jgi:LysM repeat protein
MAKISGFLGKDTAGLPNWAWLVVVGAGLAAAYIVPKFFGSSASTPSSTSTTASTDTTGLGLAIDPTTGLPYAVEGLVPSGAMTGTSTDGTGLTGPQGPVGPQGPPGTPGTPGTPTGACPEVILVCPPGTTTVHGTDANGCPTVTCTGTPTTTPAPPAPTPPAARYVTVQKWPSQLGSLSGIASKYGLSLARLEQLNPQIKNPNLIYAGQQVRIG